ncbi:hypothetical protein [Alienimonas sp. DA493]|uniref:hypothetical protein n=1 Tax=Alienimonas sp. DA493 TaxID=3373605 RepID=UPI0037543E2A
MLFPRWFLLLVNAGLVFYSWPWGGRKASWGDLLCIGGAVASTTIVICEQFGEAS